MCMVQRCGSNVLCEALSRTGVVGHPTEYFTPAFPEAEALGHDLAGFEASAWARRNGVDSIGDFMARVLDEGSTSNGVFGAKLPWNAFVSLLGKLRSLPHAADLDPIDLLASVLGPLRFVRVQRRDRLRQAVSWALASQTGHYASHEAAIRPPIRPPTFDLELIDGLLREIDESERNWDSFFADCGSEPLVVFYEDLGCDLPGVVRRLLDWIGESPAAGVDFSDLRHQRQSGLVNEEWVARYLAMRREPEV